MRRLITLLFISLFQVFMTLGQSKYENIETDWPQIISVSEPDYEAVLKSFENKSFSVQFSFWIDDQIDLLRSEVLNESVGFNIACAWTLGAFDLQFLIDNTLNMNKGDFDIEPDRTDYSMAQVAYTFSHQSLSSCSMALVFNF